MTRIGTSGPGAAGLDGVEGPGPETTPTAGERAGEGGAGAPNAARSSRPKSLDMSGLDLQSQLSAMLDAQEGGAASTPPSTGATTPAGGPNRTAASGLAPNLAPVSGEVTGALKAVAPTKFESGDTLQLLRGVESGTVELEVPVAPGKHKIRGVNVTVAPGTVMKVQVEVKDGKLVAARDEKGKEMGGGCKIDFKPPLDLPLISGKGLYLQEGKGGAGDRLKADLGGFFDIRLKKTGTLTVDSLVDMLGNKKLGVEGGDGGKESALPPGLLQTDKLKFDVKDVKFADRRIDTGTMQIDFAPGSKISLGGTLNEAVLKGELVLDGLAMDQGSMQVKAGKGTASFEARYVKNADGSSSANTKVTNLNASIQSFHSSHPPNELALSDVRVSNGTIDANLTLGPNPAGGRPQVIGVATAASFDGAGRIDRAYAVVKDAQDSAELSLEGATFEGKVAIGGPARMKLDAKLTGARVEVNGLQSKEAGRAALDVHHAKMEGDAEIRLDGAKKDLELKLTGRSFDVQVDDYSGAQGGTRVDLGRTTITGEGTIELKKGQGFKIDGALQVKGAFDDLKVAAGEGKAAIDMAAGSTVELDVKSFSVGKGYGFSLDAKGKVDVGLDGYAVDLPGMSASGSARVKGSTDLRIGGGDFLMTNTDATISVAIDDAKVAPGGKGLNLDAGKGSKLDLNVKGSTISSKPGESVVKLGPGSKLEAVLDGGEIELAGKTVKLERGSKARFDITSLTATPGGGSPTLKGKLSVDAKVDGAQASFTNLPKGAQVSVTVGDKGKANAKITIDDVTLKKDGSFSLSGVDVGLHAQAQKITGAVGADGQGVGSLSAEKVKSMTATQIAGAQGVGETRAPDPIELAKRLRSGTFEMEVPVEGTVGDSYLKSATFAPGTKVKIAVVVKDGKIDTKATRATLNQAGDAALWVTVNGVYFDESNTLRLSLGGMKDFALPGMENMPRDFSDFIDRVTEPKAGGAQKSGGSDKLSAIDFSAMKFNVKDATIEAGKIPFPGGVIDASSETRISISGTPKAATVTGKIAVNSMQLEQDGVAFKTAKGTVDFKIEGKREGAGAVIQTTLSNMNLDVQYAVQKRANGDYLHLAQGSVRGGSLTLSATAPLGPGGKPGKPKLGPANLNLPQFSGKIEGGRVTVKDKDGTAQVELGKTAVNGSVTVKPESITVTGDVTQLDVGVRSFAAGGAGASGEVGYARMQGSGKIDYSSAGGIKIDANVQSLDVDGGKVEGKFKRK
jgi:hypothetical protein